MYHPNIRIIDYMFELHLHFPDSPIGSLADWAMVILTAATAVLLLLTLKSQRAVQKSQIESLDSQRRVELLQTRITRIEDEKFKKEIKPRFTASLMQNPVFEYLNDDEIEIRTLFTLCLLENECIDFTVTNTSIFTEDIETKVIVQPVKYLMPDEEKTMMVVIRCRKKAYDLAGLSLVSQLRFSDVVGGNYKQNIKTYFKVESAKLNVNSPVRLDVIQ